MKSILNVGDKLTLVPKTRHARNRINENGANVTVSNIDGVILAKKVCVIHDDNKDAWRWFDVVDDIDWDWELR